MDADIIITRLDSPGGKPIGKKEWIQYIADSDFLGTDSQGRTGRNPLTGEVILIKTPSTNALLLVGDEPVNIWLQDGEIIALCDGSGEEMPLLQQIAADFKAEVKVNPH